MSESSVSGARHDPALETAGLTKLGSSVRTRFEAPDRSILEAFPNRYPERDYVVRVLTMTS